MMLAPSEKAIELDPDYAYAHAKSSIARSNLQGPEAGLAAARKGLELDPNDAESWFLLAAALIRNGQAEEAIAAGETSMRLNPRGAPSYFYLALGRAYYVQKDYKSTLETAQDCVLTYVNYGPCQSILLSSLVRLDQLDRAQLAASEALQRIPDFEQRYWSFGALKFHFETERQHIFDDLRSLGIAIPEDAA